MCNLCKLITDNLQEGEFITSQTPCPKVIQFAAARGLRITRLAPSPSPLLPPELLLLLASDRSLWDDYLSDEVEL